MRSVGCRNVQSDLGLDELTLWVRHLRAKRGVFCATCGTIEINLLFLFKMCF